MGRNCMDCDYLRELKNVLYCGAYTSIHAGEAALQNNGNCYLKRRTLYEYGGIKFIEFVENVSYGFEYNESYFYPDVFGEKEAIDLLNHFTEWMKSNGYGTDCKLDMLDFIDDDFCNDAKIESIEKAYATLKFMIAGMYGKERKFYERYHGVIENQIDDRK